MPERPRPAIAEIPHRVREWLQDAPRRWREFRAGFRDDPGLLWRSPTIRLAGLLMGGLLLVLAVRGLVHGLTPPIDAAPQAEPMATLFVACSNPACLASTTVQKPLDFKDWPLACARCGRESVYRARQCPVCREWYAIAPGDPPACPLCARKAARHPPRTATAPHSTSDAEDPW